MSTPPADPGAVTYAPVNVARPNWQCPHCFTKYSDNLEAATECAQAGPATQVAEGAPVLILDRRTTGFTRNRTSLVLGLTEVGPVTVVREDGQARRHRRDVVVAGHTVSSERLAAAPAARDGLLLLTEDREAGGAATLSRGDFAYGDLKKVFLGESRYGDYYDSAVKVWVEANHATRDLSWWRAPDEGERAAINTITSGLLDTIVQADEDDLVARIRDSYSPSARNHRGSGQSPVDLANYKAGLMVADAHGSPNHVWSMRWLTANLDAVTRWQASTLRAWAAGDSGPLPMATWLMSPESLPKNPGKRRLAVMEPFGPDYESVRRAIERLLVTDAPVNPVPGIGDVAESIRPTTRK